MSVDVGYCLFQEGSPKQRYKYNEIDFCHFCSLRRNFYA